MTESPGGGGEGAKGAAGDAPPGEGEAAPGEQEEGKYSLEVRLGGIGATVARASSRVEPGTAEKQIKGGVKPALTEEDFAAQRRGQQIEAGEQKLADRRKVANWALRLVALQVVTVDAMVGVIAWQSGWHLDPGVFKTWLAATVVQVIGVVVVITRYLFPEGAPDDLSMTRDDRSGSGGDTVA